MTPLFERASNQDIADLVRSHPLAWVISQGVAGMAVTPLPLLADLDAEGAIIRLVGHFARSNPHVAALERDPRALILFQGPHGYITPTWVADRTWGPTWNYAYAQFETEIRFLPEETDRALARLVDTMEAGRPGAWSIAELGERYPQLRDRVIAFHAEVRAVRGRFKLGQDERPDVLAQILDGLGESDLTTWMRRFNTDKPGPAGC